MTPEEKDFQKRAFQAVKAEPLEAGDARYVELTAVRGGEDPVARMARTIELSGEESVQLFAGFPGTGKTTELRRLERSLSEAGHRTFYYPVLPREMVFSGRTTPTTLIEEAEALDDAFRAFKVGDGDVLIIDNAEHIWGYRLSAHAIQDALMTLLSGTVARKAHVVCTVPHLQGRSQDAILHVLYDVRVRGIDHSRQEEGVRALAGVLAARFEIGRLMGEVAQEEVVQASGGRLAHLMFLAREIVLNAKVFPVTSDVVGVAIAKLRDEVLSFGENDVPSLATVARTRKLTADASRALVAYRNGREWYDVHPLLRDKVLADAREPTPHPTPVGPEAAPPSPKPERAPVTLTPDMRVTLVVENYRALRRVRWTLPRGVSAIVGPNGSGKTTLLDIPALLRQALTHDLRRAIDSRGGTGNIRNQQAERDACVLAGVELDELAWQIDLSPKAGAFDPNFAEKAIFAGGLMFDAADRASAQHHPEDARPLLRRFSEEDAGTVLRPLVALLEGYRLYGTYDVLSIRENGSQASSDKHLHADGRNIFSVLRNWRDRKETRPRWDFVITSLKEAFPDTFEDLDFETAGQTISGRIVTPSAAEPLPTYFAANGWLIALLHLAAVASTEPAGVVAIDEVENGLHPFAIRALIEAMRTWSAQTGISVVLATHSPVVLDQFKEEPDHVFVMEPGRDVQPQRLDELHDPEWLAHFSLGNLYAHEEFGAQHLVTDRIA